MVMKNFIIQEKSHFPHKIENCYYIKRVRKERKLLWLIGN